MDVFLVVVGQGCQLSGWRSGGWGAQRVEGCSQLGATSGGRQSVSVGNYCGARHPGGFLVSPLWTLRRNLEMMVAQGYG